jgi:hypothetical protein
VAEVLAGLAVDHYLAGGVTCEVEERDSEGGRGKRGLVAADGPRHQRSGEQNGDTLIYNLVCMQCHVTA